MLRLAFSDLLELEDINNQKLKLCRSGPYLTRSVSYGPYQGFEIAVPAFETSGSFSGSFISFN